MSVKFFKCNTCGNIVGLIKDSGVPLMCCGKAMEELAFNTSDGATEKHVPVVNVEGNVVSVGIGSVDHPMVDEHYIEWIYIETTSGGQRKTLKPGDDPKVMFVLSEDDKLISVYAYCNLHGLWKTNA